MKRELLFILLLYFFITLFFFYPVLQGKIPFAGDLLVSYPPYSSQGYLGYAPGGVPNKAQGQDSIRESFPWKYFTIDSFKRLQIPFWTPYNLSGNPILANFQSAVFYPLNIIFLALPFTTGWTIFIFLSPFLASFFAYLFLRELGLSKISSIFGGIVFGFSSYMTVQLEWGNVTHTFLWLPLALYFTEKLSKKFVAKNAIGLTVVLWCSILAGYIQGFFYIIIAVICYFLFKQTVSKQKADTSKKFHIFNFTFSISHKSFRILLFTINLVFPFLLSLFQLLPTVELFANSTRLNYTLDQFSTLLNPLWYFITVLVPDFFGNPGVRSYWFNGTYVERVSYFGAIPFLLALAAVFSFNKRKEIAFFAITLLITFILSANFGLNKYFYLIPIPMISTTVPTRILSLFEFCGCMLAAFGLEFFIERKQKKQFLMSSIIGGLLVLGSWILVFALPKLSSQPWVSNLFVTKRNLLLPTFFVAVFIALYLARFYERRTREGKRPDNWKIGFGVIIIVITIFDLFYFFQKITPFSPKAFIYPQTAIMSFIQQNAGINRFWGYGSAYISSNFQTLDRTFSPEGDDPLHGKLYAALVSTSKRGIVGDSLSRLDVNIAPGYGSSDLPNNFYRQKILNILGVKYIVHKNDLAGNSPAPDTTTFPPDRYKLVWQEAPWQIYENLHAAPRVFLTSKYQVASIERDTIKTLLSKNFNESQKITVSEDPKLPSVQLAHTSVQLISYTPNEVKVQAQTDSAALLFLSDNYFPGWKASIDGQSAKIYRADYSFRAVKLSAGKHVVDFWYYPESFDWGSKASAGVLVILVCMVYFIKKRRWNFSY